MSVDGYERELIQKYPTPLLTNTFLEITRNGGPEEAVGLPDWKNGLIGSNATWKVIDRGTTLVPVWEIIEMSHDQDFKDASYLAQVMKQAMNKMSPSDCRNVKECVEAVDIEKLINEWTENADMYSSEYQLALLVEKKQQLVRKSLSLNAWPIYCLSQQLLQQFLRSIIDKNIKRGLGTTRQSDNIKRLVLELVEPIDLNAVEDFPDRQHFCKLLYDIENVDIPMKSDNIFSLEVYFNYILEYMYDEKPMSDKKTIEIANAPDISIRVTAILAKNVLLLRKHLQRTKQYYEELFIMIILIPFNYDPDSYTFLTLISVCDIEYLCSKYGSYYTLFFKMLTSKQLTKKTLQVYILSMAVEVCEVMDVMEARRKYLVQYIEHKIGDDIDPSIAKTLQKLNSKNCDWKWFHDESPLPKFFLLGLTKYYPQGLTVQNALEIREDTINTMNSFESKGHGANSTQHKFMDPKLYPFIILQRIMAFDYKCRIKLTVQTDKSKMGGKENSGIDLSKFILEEEADVETVHPMDGILALLHCADNFLRQDLMSRMSTCQLAIPLLLPDPFTGNLIFPLWAMRSIVKEWKGSGSHASEGPLISHPAPLVSFARIGAHRHSKSRTLNTIINDSGHDWFFHFDCDGGNAKQLLVNGLAEVCWYLPSETNTIFPDVVTFANLHGDARELTKQVNFLSEISLMNFVLLNVTELADERSSQVLQSLAKAPGGLVLLVAIPTEPAWKGQLKEVLESLPNGKCNIIMLDKNEADIREKVRQKINEKFTIPEVKLCVLEECTKIAYKCGITTDEDGKDCVKGKELAYQLKDIIYKHSKPEKSAKELLPLQGSQLWHEWSKHDKEQYRQFDRKQESPDVYAAEQRSKMQAIRQRQSSTTPSKLMKTFLENVVLHHGIVRLYFLQWLKMILDNLSIKQLAQLHSQYQQKKQELQKEYHKTLEKLKKERNEDGKEEQRKKFEEIELVLKKELKKLNGKIIDSSFGLEHLLREIGQVYEAVRTKPDVKRHVSPNEKLILDLPRVAAELMIDGHPLELMDGDTAHVPETWVLAVLEQIQKILEDPPILVLSIVGLQSTGKSTLMNTVFGLQFSVSAGRCTRGAFMQLVSMHSSLRQECKCDYFLIVDTEGLRAPELDAFSTQKHDNELATFVIGLANITIVNISGGVAGDIEDILQTAVHAFLRMNKVNLTPGCHFVHHNVAAVMAGEKGAVGRSKFKQKLDEMTQLAAKVEHLEDDYDSFSQVIKFDDEKDVTHFPGLWKGDPPMAPVNDGYSSKAQSLKSHFISLAKSNQKNIVQISVFSHHLKQLWKAILHENFVFSFKNTFEFVAYSALDIEYGKLSWKLQESMMKWEQQTQNKIGSCKPDQLNTVYTECKVDLLIFVLKRYDDAEKEMKEYFRTSDKREIIKQWEVRTAERLKDLRRQLKVHAEEHCEQLFHSQKALDDVKAKKDDHRARIVERVKQLASELEKRELTCHEVEQKFDREWTMWMTQLAKDKPKRHKNVDVLSEVTKSLTESDVSKNCHGILVHKIEEKPLQYWGEHLALNISTTHIQVESAGWFGHKKPAANIQAAQTITDDIFQKVREHLDQRKGKTFHPSLTVELIFILNQEVQRAILDKFPFTHDYMADMALTTCGYAVRVFRRMVEDFMKQNDPVEYMEREMRQPLLSHFKDLYCKIAQEKIAAHNLCELLYNPVKKQVMSSLSPTIVSYMVREFPWIQTKPALKSILLLDIGKNLEESRNNFGECALYLTDIKKSLHNWIKRFTMKECKQGNPSRLVCLANRQLSILVSHLKKISNRVTKEVLGEIEEGEYDTDLEDDTSEEEEDETDDKETEDDTEGDERHEEIEIAVWLTKFHERVVGKLELDANELGAFRGSNDVQMVNAHSFTSEVIKGLRKLHRTLLESNDFRMLLPSDMNNWSIKPYDIMSERYSGCTEQCPFCKEQCDYTDNGHLNNHFVTLHRPECLGGYRWSSSKEMSIDLCTTHVASDVTFANPKTDNKPHPYKEYQKIYPQWNIIADRSIEASSFWKWVVANYTTEIATKFHMEETDIPVEWKKLTWEKVREDLQKAFHFV